MPSRNKNIKYDQYKNSCTVLVTSCDSYEDLWGPFFKQFFKHWSDCPFPIYLGTETKVIDDNRITTVLSQGERIWSNCLIKQIAQIQTPYILLLLEDFFLRKDVHTEEVLVAFDFLLRHKGKMMRIGRNKPWPSRGIDGPINKNINIAVIKPGYPCRITLQAAFWEKQALIDLCKCGESIWQFETKGSERSWRWEEGFFCTMKDIFPYKHHVVARGKWLWYEALYFSNLNIGCDFSKRKLMTSRDYAKWIFYKIKSLFNRVLYFRR